jgi:DNA-binding HxlR family transcriptional regulator
MASPGDEWDAALSPSGRPVGSGDGGISTKTLTDRLRMLEAEGWLTRHYEPTVPPQVTYEITKKVLELDGVIRNSTESPSSGTARMPRGVEKRP